MTASPVVITRDYVGPWVTEASPCSPLDVQAQTGLNVAAGLTRFQLRRPSSHPRSRRGSVRAVALVGEHERIEDVLRCVMSNEVAGARQMRVARVLLEPSGSHRCQSSPNHM